MTESQSLVDAFASTTGAIMTDSMPILIYLLGLTMVCVFVILISRAYNQVKKIFK